MTDVKYTLICQRNEVAVQVPACLYKKHISVLNFFNFYHSSSLNLIVISYLKKKVYFVLLSPFQVRSCCMYDVYLSVHISAFRCPNQQNLSEIES